MKFLFLLNVFLSMGSGSISVSVVSASSVWVETSTSCLSKSYAQLSTVNTDTNLLSYLSGVVCSRMPTRADWKDFASVEDFVRKECFRIGCCEETGLRALNPGPS
jgi:hypothetical protein